jgi:hypothetical protein
MKTPFPTVSIVLADARRVAVRFPFVVLCAAVGTTTSIMAVEAEGPLQNRVIMACSLGLPLMLALRLLRERLESPQVRGLLLEAAGILLLVGYALSIPGDFEWSPAIFWERFFILNIGLHLAVAFVPCLTGAGDREFWQFNRRLFQRFALSVLYSAVLYIGFALAIGSSDKLFALHVEGKRYSELWIIMTGMFNTLFFLGGVPVDRLELQGDESYPRGLRAFAQFALAPLVIVFVPILYLYAIKIVRHWSWPHGWVALPVCSLAVVGILAALLLQPARTIETERWARWYWRNFFRALAPLSVLLLLSMHQRISAYGVTEWRYFGFVIGGWLLAVSTYFIIRPGGSTRLIPASLALICFISSAGPWGVFSVSSASQKHRLIELLQPFGAVENGGLVPAKRALPAADINSARSILTHLIMTYGIERDPELFSGFSASKMGADNRKNDNGNTYVSVQSVITYVTGTNDALLGGRARPNASGFVSVDLDMEGGLPVEGYRALYHACVCPGNGVQKLGDLSVEFPAGGAPPRISFGGKPLDVAALEARLASIAASGAKNKHKLPPSEMSAKLASGTREWLLIFDKVQARTRKGSRPDLSEIEIYLLEK